MTTTTMPPTETSTDRLVHKIRVRAIVFFALAQIPMYTLPALLKPMYSRLTGAPPAAR